MVRILKGENASDDNGASDGIDDSKFNGVDARDSGGRTALHRAVESGNLCEMLSIKIK